MYTYVSTSKREISERKRRAYAEYCKVINWGRKYPVAFAERFLGVGLLDFQQYAFYESWTKQFALWLMCRGAGKTAVAAPFLMTKMMLVPNYQIYIGATSQQQAIISFRKLEDMAMDRLPSFQSLTDIFRHEIEHKAGNSPFKHDPAGYTFKLFNNSSVTTLSSNSKGVRGLRGSVWYDESSFITKEFVDVCDQFVNVDSSFGLAAENEVNLQRPKQMPLQLLYTSSAGSIDSVFYDKFKTYFKNMIAGDSRYFVCDFDCYAVLDHSTKNGRPVTSHLNRDKLEADIRDNPEAAEHELFNHFKRGAGTAAVVSDDCLIRNSFARLPVFHNDDGKRKFILCFDPARNYDNSILGIFEVRYDEKIGYYLDVVNVISMMDTEAEKKRPLNYLEQIKIIQKTMVAYNGAAPEWENIEFYIDAGSGGAGRSGIADQLLLSWTDTKGEEHRGIIDPDDPVYEEERRKRPGNAKIVHLLEPARYKNKIFGALAEVADLNLIHFPEYDGHRDYIMLPIEKNGSLEYKEHSLSQEEKEALVQIELMKTEISYMCCNQSPSSNTVNYSLVRSMQHRMHDDRAYVLAMGAYALWEMRNKDLRNRRLKKDENILFPCRKPVLPKIGRL